MVTTRADVARSICHKPWPGRGQAADVCEDEQLQAVRRQLDALAEKRFRTGLGADDQIRWRKLVKLEQSLLARSGGTDGP